MKEILFVIGLIFIFLGITLIILAFSENVEVGVGGFIGPIPFGFATSKPLLILILLINILILVLIMFQMVR